MPEFFSVSNETSAIFQSEVGSGIKTINLLLVDEILDLLETSQPSSTLSLNKTPNVSDDFVLTLSHDIDFVIIIP